MKFAKLKIFFLLFLSTAENVRSKILMLMKEEFEDCTKGGSSKFIDWTGIEFDYVNDTTYFLDGTIRESQSSKFEIFFFRRVEDFEKDYESLASSLLR